MESQSIVAGGGGLSGAQGAGSPTARRAIGGTRSGRRSRAGRALLRAAVGAALAAMGGAARAEDVTWVSGLGGLWNEPSNWSSAPSVPGATADVTIDVAGSLVDITIPGGTYSIHSLISNERLIVNSGELSVAAASQANADFALSSNGSRLSGAGNFTINSTSTWIDESYMSGTGKTIVSATGSMDILPGSWQKYLNRSFDNFGAINFKSLSSPYGTISMTNSTFTNKVGATFTAIHDLDGFIYGEVGINSFLNQGTFLKSGTATLTINGAGAASTVFQNDGSVGVQAGTLKLLTSATHSGSFAVSAGATLWFEGSQIFTAASTVNSSGNVTFQNGGTTTFGGSFASTGVSFSGGTHTFNGGMVASTLSAISGTTLIFNGTATAGAATFASDMTIGGSGVLTLTGASTWTGPGIMSGSGKTAVAAGATLDLIASGSIGRTLARTLENSGTINWGDAGPGAAITLTGATINNLATGIFNITGDNYALTGASGLNLFNNAGSIAKSGTGSATFGGSGGSIIGLVNSGTVTVSAGLLTFAGALSNSGTISLSGGTIAASQGIANTGLIDISGGAFNLGGINTTAQLGSVHNPATIGQLNILGTLDNTGATLALTNNVGSLRMLAGSQLIGGTISTSAGAKLIQAGSATFDGVTLSGAATMRFEADGTFVNGLTLSAGASFLPEVDASAKLTFTGSQTIAGSGTIQPAGTNAAAILTLTAASGGTLTVGSNITIKTAAQDMIVGSAGASVTFLGTALADVSGRTLTIAGTSVQNSGTFEAKNGATIDITGALANLSGGTLTGGAWRASAGGVIRATGGNVTANAATIVLDGVNSHFYQGAGTTDALVNLAQNLAAGQISLLNGKTLTTAGDLVSAGALTIGVNSTLTIPGTLSGAGSVTVNGALMTTASTLDGAFTLNSGTHSTTADFIVGNTLTTATYTLSGGTLAVGGFATIGYGASGAGVFTQTAGAFTAAKQIYIASGGSNTSIFNLSGGTVDAQELHIAFLGGAHGTVNQSGGTITLSGGTSGSSTAPLTIGFSSLATTQGTYNLSGGVLADNGAFIGYAGTGAFSQSGGTHTIGGTLGLRLGVFSGGTGSYSLSNTANLSVAGQEQIGYSGNGVFNQTGGTHTLVGTMVLGVNSAGSGNYSLSGGLLTADAIDLRRGKFTQSGGTLNATVFSQNGGEVAGALQNQGTFNYNAGLFSGRLINSGTVALAVNFTAGNGLDNRANFAVATGRTVALNGAGLTNAGGAVLTLGGGTLTAASTLNDGTFTQALGDSNLGAISGTGAYSVGGGTFAATSAVINGGFTVTAGSANLGALSGTGTVTVSGGTLTATTTGNIGTFTQTLGDANLGAISGTGAYSVGGGTFAATSAVINGGFTVTAGTANLGALSGIGNVTVNGGTLTATSAIVAGAFAQTNGQANLGAVSGAGTFTVGGGTFTATSIAHSGTFTQTLGTANLGAVSGTGSYSVGGGALIATSAVINGGLTVTAGSASPGVLSGTGNIAVNGGTLTTTSAAINGTFTQTAGQANLGALTGTGSVTIGGGTLAATSAAINGAYTQSAGQATLGNVTGTGTISLSGGTLAIGAIHQTSLDAQGIAVVTMAAGSITSRVNALTVATAPGSTAALDLADNAMVVDYTGASPLDSIRTMIIAGSAGGWTGAGLRSSVAAGNSSVKVGFAEASQVLGITGPATADWHGETVDATSILIKPTRAGDADFDGIVGLNDLLRLANNYGNSGVTWTQGDFDYDGLVGLNDLLILANNYGLAYAAPVPGASPSFAADMQIAFSSVPEPSGLAVIVGMASAALFRRTRRAAPRC